MENKTPYITLHTPDPYEDLKNYMSPADVARLVNQLRAVWGAGHGFGRVVLSFKHSRMSRPETTISAGEECGD